MTADKFRWPLWTEVDGTLHLHQVFASALLNHFVMLSSLSGIIGSRGQGNYVAGNAFQDRFAWTTSTQARSETRYLTIDLGLGREYLRLPGRNRPKEGAKPASPGLCAGKLGLAQGCIDVHSEPKPSTGVRLIVVRIDGESLLEAENATQVSHSSMFTHVRASCSKVADRKASGVQGESQGHHIQCEKHRRRFQAYCIGPEHQTGSADVCQSRSLPSDVPLLDFGLHSLTAVDPKTLDSEGM